VNEEQNEYTLPHVASVWSIRSPWRDLLLASIKQVRHSLLLVSPFLTEDVIAALETVLQKDREELKIKSHLGPKIALHGSSKKRLVSITPLIKERAIPSSAAETTMQDLPPPVPGVSKNTSLSMQEPSIDIPSNTIFLSGYDFWRALNWTFPFTKQHLWHQSGAYLRIDWFAVSSELQFTRANEAQLSRATIKAYTTHTTQENRHMTINSNTLQELFEIVRAGDRITSSPSASHLDYQISLEAWPGQSGINKLQVPIDINEQLHAFRSVDPTRHIQNIPQLQKPLSHIIIKHKTLVEQVALLETQWQKNHPGTPFPAIVELRFSPSENSPGIVLSTGPLDHRLEVFVAGNNCIRTDPSLTLRLDTTALQQVFESTHSLIDEWHLQMGDDASALQLFPAQVQQEKSHLWFHHLNTIE
jgi:hypothetical protein